MQATVRVMRYLEKVPFRFMGFYLLRMRLPAFPFSRSVCLMSLGEGMECGCQQFQVSVFCF
jgi:hypothetical protein